LYVEYYDLNSFKLDQYKISDFSGNVIQEIKSRGSLNPTKKFSSPVRITNPAGVLMDPTALAALKGRKVEHIILAGGHVLDGSVGNEINRPKNIDDVCRPKETRFGAEITNLGITHGTQFGAHTLLHTCASATFRAQTTQVIQIQAKNGEDYVHQEGDFTNYPKPKIGKRPKNWNPLSHRPPFLKEHEEWEVIAIKLASNEWTPVSADPIHGDLDKFCGEAPTKCNKAEMMIRHPYLRATSSAVLEESSLAELGLDVLEKEGELDEELDEELQEEDEEEGDEEDDDAGDA
jgi:hypothetical protein